MAHHGHEEDPKQQKMKGNWNQFKGQVKEKWGKLTDDELDQLEGRRDQLVGRLQERTGERREVLEKDVDEMSRRSNYSW